MRPEILSEVLKRLKAEYGLQEQGTYLRKGKCPQCDKKELWTLSAKPWVLRCGRMERCGWEGHVKELFPDIFDDWSKRYQRTPEVPNAAADAYLLHARGFDLTGLRGSYSQEHYHDRTLNIGSATVRFPLPGGTYWERLIDQPARFGKKKAAFGYGGSYRGEWWTQPSLTIAALAAMDEVWIAEGIFDATALNQSPAFRDHGRLAAVSAMSCNNYPKGALDQLRRAAADAGLKLPRLVFAFDVGRAGTEYTRRFVKDARAEGWDASAAQARPDGEIDGGKLDWNDLFQRDRLTTADLADYRWNGDVTIAPNAMAKANLIYRKERFASFPFTFASRQYWATVSTEKVNAILEEWSKSDSPEHAEFKAMDWDEKYNAAASQAISIEELANCQFRTLYYQRDPNIEEGAYYFRVDFPSDRPTVKATFSGSACTAGAEFKKRLASVAHGALWTGSTQQLDKLMQRQWATVPLVDAIQHTGYSIEHKAYIFGDLAVHNGRVHEPNAEDYFVLGKQSVKLRTTDRILKIRYDADNLDLSWVRLVWIAYGPKGLIVLAFWVLSFFAEQIRAVQSSIAFLEATGIPGTGKSTLLEFLWKASGRANYEGFDPTKATNAAIARTLGAVGNLPVVLIEGDRGQDTPHSKRFEWDELKTAYNGRAVRTRAIANGGMETFEPPFRGAVIIAQNATVEASNALRERIMALDFDKSRFSERTKEAVERLVSMDGDTISGFPVHIVRREAEILKTYFERFAHHEALMLKHPGIRNGRLAKNHAQLAAMVDAMQLVIRNIGPSEADETQRFILAMLEERQRSTESDHPHVEKFWENFDFIQSRETADRTTGIDHSRTPDVLAVSMPHFESRCADYRLSLPCAMNELKRLLKTSKARKFIAANHSVNSVTGKIVSCWTFRNPDHSGATK